MFSWKPKSKVREGRLDKISTGYLTLLKHILIKVEKACVLVCLNITKENVGLPKTTTTTTTTTTTNKNIQTIKLFKTILKRYDKLKSKNKTKQ